MRKKTSTTDRAKKPKTSRKLLDLPVTSVKGTDAAAVKGGKEYDKASPKIY